MVTLKNLFTLVLFLFFANSFLFSQPISKNDLSKICYTMFASGSDYSELEKNLMNKLQTSLEKNDLFSIDSFHVELLLGIKEIDGMNKVAISVAELWPLTKEQIQRGKKVEMFYSSKDEKDKNNLTDDGKFIREYVSEEYLKQFRTVWNNTLEIIDLSELDNFVQKLVSKYLYSQK